MPSNASATGGRQYFRIIFPVTQRPRMHVETCEFTILEISEGGATLDINAKTPPTWSEPHCATIVLADSTRIVTQAVAERSHAPGVLAVRFVELLPLSVITAEQRRLSILFPRTK